MTEITKWEYKRLGASFDEDDYNELGKQGYEMVGMNNQWAIFKRPCGRLKVIEKVNGREINPEQSQDTTYER